MKRTQIAYGVGQLYHARKESYNFDYVCDRTLDNIDGFYEGKKIISLKQLKSFSYPGEVIVFIKNQNDYAEIRHVLEYNKNLIVKHCYDNEPQVLNYSSADYLSMNSDKKRIELANDNECLIKDCFPEGLTLCIWGKNNKIYLGEHISVNENLKIVLGTNSVVRLGDNLRVTSSIITASYGTVSIGNDCLFSSNVFIRNTNGHHIFEKNSKERIDVPTDCIIHDNVWLCENVSLLSGSEIGKGSIVGANSVTSSSFDEHLIIAGNPARIIRRDVVWSRDSEYFFNHESYDMCYSKDFLEYL